MKKHLILSLCLLAGCAQGQNSPSRKWLSEKVLIDVSNAAKTINDWEIVLEPSSNSVVQINLINQSDKTKTLAIDEDVYGSWYFLAFKSGTKERVPYTSFYKSLNAQPTLGFRSLAAFDSRKIRPGVKWIHRLDLARVFDLSRPGSYDIYVKRLTDGKDMLWATSNKYIYTVKKLVLDDVNGKNLRE